jgi:RNA polymerase sigma-70 factor, ECF subfamily
VITEEIINNFIQGEKEGFDKIYEAYSSGMYMLCLRYTRCDDDAKDVLQEAFIKVFRYRNQYHADKPIGPWIKTIVIRTALNYIKEQYRFKLTDDDLFFDEVQNQEDMEDKTNDMKLRLLKVLQQLPEGYRTIFNLLKEPQNRSIPKQKR